MKYMQSCVSIINKFLWALLLDFLSYGNIRVRFRDAVPDLGGYRR